ncbi:RteC domain-containing protein [Bacteroidales bacterium OttesenSCG-928-K22]|nr:RteC domain-containing protein [Bacteroidales bacterium OttesenSCG-928-L14]MDL2240198.1 RteC domain-containing protein [Bacteroidales bacterium OttesenSCG-928-K22]
MKQKIETLVRDTELQIKEKEDNLIDIIRDAPIIISILESKFVELKKLISKYKFESQNDEIVFFKDTKPKLFCKLIYYQNIYHIALQCPMTGAEARKKYLKKELEQINDYCKRNSEFIQYYRSKSTNADSYYFVRGIKDLNLNTENFYFERDASFSTICDFKVAKLLSNDMLASYLNNELSKIERKKYYPEKVSEFQSHVNWSDSKVALVELIYAIDTAQSVNYGKIDLKTLSYMFEKLFNIELNDIYHKYLEIRNRKKERTIYLNRLVKLLNERMDEADCAQ